MTGLYIFITFAIAKVLVCLYFWLSTSKNWKACVYAALACASLSMIMLEGFLTESPRFLASKNEFKQAIDVLKKIQKINGVNKEEFILNGMEPNKKEIFQEEQGTLRDLWIDPALRINLIVMMITWSFGSFAFFMIPYYLKNIPANIYYLSLATEAAELLASIVCAFIQKFMPLKLALFSSCVFIAIGSFCLIFLNK